ncbi:MAG: hypothetical protein HYV02_08845 [Deltaproteobacteria bacterium]|nr:hypothetical protein [Deltaproteobacteria bacterium]
MIRRIRNYIRTRGVGIRWSPYARRPQAPHEQPPVDAHATFQAGPQEEWTYRGGRLYLNNAEIEEYTDPAHPDIPAWCHLIDALHAYRDWAFTRGVPHFRRMAFAINGAQEKILKQMRRLYELQIGGMTLTLGDGTVLLNNVNIRALLAMYHVRPTNKARKFLEGMRSKLALILCHHNDSPQVSRVARVVQDLYDEIGRSLTRETIDALRLSDGRGVASRPMV